MMEKIRGKMLIPVGAILGFAIGVISSQVDISKEINVTMKQLKADQQFIQELHKRAGNKTIRLTPEERRRLDAINQTISKLDKIIITDAQYHKSLTRKLSTRQTTKGSKGAKRGALAGAGISLAWSAGAALNRRRQNIRHRTR